MAVEVVTAEEYMGDVIGDLSSRRGKINGMEPARQRQVHRRRGAAWPQMFGYSTDLRCRCTKGRARHTMQFHHYAVVANKSAST